MKDSLSRLVMLFSVALIGCTKRLTESPAVRTNTSLAKEYGFALSSPDQTAQPFSISLPRDFVATETVTKGAMQSFGYSRPITKTGMKALFEVTVTPIPPEVKGLSLEEIVAGFVRFKERRSDGFRVAAYVRGTIGGAESLGVDWEGARNGHAKKGRTIYVTSDSRLFAICFEDGAAAWEESIPGIEKALQTFAFSK